MGKGSQTDGVLVLEALKSCIKSKDLALGKNVHAYLIVTRMKLPVLFLNLIMDMYAKCGSLQDACVVFAGIHRRDLVSWNVMIFSHARHGYPDEAVRLYKQVEAVGLLPDDITFLGILDVGASLRHFDVGTQIHSKMAFSGLKLSNMVTNALINTYSKCGRMDLACKVFVGMDERDIVAWNTVLAGYAMLNNGCKVWEVFQEMEKHSVKPDPVSYLSTLTACASMGDLEHGKQVHRMIDEAGIMSDVVLENALLNMYTKCGSIETASQLFSKMSVRNVISWTVMISTHSTLGNVNDALFLFQQMQCEGLIPNDITILSILCGCSSSTELKKGKEIHTAVVGGGLDAVANVGNALVSMYFRCGSLTDARRCFDKMKIHDVVTWNTMVSGYAKHGHGKVVLEVVEHIVKEGFKLDSGTLACVLSACSNVGLVAEGLSLFDAMEREIGIVPNANHYNCVVDLLGRAGHLGEADEFYDHIPNAPNFTSWRTLLNACKIHGDSERAKARADLTIQLQPNNIQALETMSNMNIFWQQALSKFTEKVPL